MEWGEGKEGGRGAGGTGKSGARDDKRKEREGRRRDKGERALEETLAGWSDDAEWGDFKRVFSLGNRTEATHLLQSATGDTAFHHGGTEYWNRKI